MIRHLPDLDLDVQKLFHEGLQPILLVVQEHTEYTGLVVAMFSRLAIDYSLHDYGQPEAKLIFTMFCESKQANL